LNVFRRRHMEVIEKHTVSDLLHYLRLSHDHWQFAQVITTANIWIFRGQGDSRWPLTPKSLRSRTNATEADNLPLPWRALAREYNEVTQFLQLADEIGILPLSGRDFPAFYTSITQAATSQDAPLPEYTTDALEAFALAQHHGIPTRLLDWSASPFTAAFFAARDAFVSDDDRAYFAVWAMPRQRPGDDRIKVITPSRSLNRFAHRQSGYLTLDLLADRHYDDSYGWPSQDVVLDEYQRSWGDGSWPCLRKIVVPKSCAADLLIALYQEGVSVAHLMPTLDNVAETMLLERSLHPIRLMRLKELLAARSVIRSGTSGE